MHVCIIGGGISGISNAIHLKKCGYKVSLFEKYSSLGGIWVNGIANKNSNLQTPSLFYYFDFKARWKNRYPDRSEIHKQIIRVCEKLDEEDIHLNTTVKSLDLTEEGKVVIKTDSHEYPPFDGCIVATGLHQKDNFLELERLESSQHGTYIPFSGIDKIASWTNKKVVIVGLGASAVEAFLTVIKENPKHIVITSTNPRWVFPNNRLYFIISCFPYGKPGQFVDRWVGHRLQRYYRKNKLEQIMPATTPAATGPGSISKQFFKICQKNRPEFILNDKIASYANGNIKFTSGRQIENVDVLISCTGWKKIDFSFIRHEGLSQAIEKSMVDGYLYLHEFVPGYNSVVFSNYKSGLGYTGFAPYISSILLQNYLEQKDLFPSTKEQSMWVEAEKIKWKGTPHHFQYINMFESVKCNAKFLSDPARGRWFLEKFKAMLR